MSKQRNLVTPQSVRQKHFGIAARISGSRGQAGASLLQCVAGGCRHLCRSRGFRFKALGLEVGDQGIDGRLERLPSRQRVDGWSGRCGDR